MKSSFLVLLFQITDSLEIVCIDLAIFQAGIWLNIIIKFNYFYIPASCFQLWNYYIIYDLSMWNRCNTDRNLVVIAFRSRNFAFSCCLCLGLFCAASVVAASVAAAVVSAALLPHPARTVIAAVAATANDNHLFFIIFVSSLIRPRWSDLPCLCLLLVVCVSFDSLNSNTSPLVCLFHKIFIWL